MDAEAYCEAKLASGYARCPKYEPGVYGTFGLFVAYITVLALGAFAHFPMEKLEAAMNSAVIAGFVVPYAYFRHLRRRHLKAFHAEYEKLRGCSVDDLREMSKKIGSRFMGQWGTPYTIGFINE
jgi:hypothetical protein